MTLFDQFLLFLRHKIPQKKYILKTTIICNPPPNRLRFPEYILISWHINPKYLITKGTALNTFNAENKSQTSPCYPCLIDTLPAMNQNIVRNTRVITHIQMKELALGVEVEAGTRRNYLLLKTHSLPITLYICVTLLNHHNSTLKALLFLLYGG